MYNVGRGDIVRKILIVFTCLAIIFSLVACNNIKFTEKENKTVVSTDGTEYTFVGNEGAVYCFGEWELIGCVKGEKRSFFHLSNLIKTGMYSVNGSQDVLVRYFPDNEWAAVYVKSELLEKDVSLDNCIRFSLVKGNHILNSGNVTLPDNGITECEQFLNDIKSGQTAEEAGLYDLIRKSDGTLNNCYIYGYVCGVLQEDLNLVIPLQINSFDDKAYSIEIDEVNYVLSEEWLNKLINASNGHN